MWTGLGTTMQPRTLYYEDLHDFTEGDSNKPSYTSDKDREKLDSKTIGCS